MTDLWLAVDGGNTKTVALVFDASGEVVGRGSAGNVDLSGAVSEDAAIGELVAAVAGALSTADVRVEQVRHAALRLAGIDWPEDAAAWREALARELPTLGSVSVDSDAYGPLRLVAPDGVGISIVLGTGPAVAARGANGHAVSLGWWLQEPLGAVGLGHAALARVYKAELGMAPPTLLTARVLEHFGAADPEMLLHSFTHRGGERGWRDLASLGPVVTELATGGDPDASRIVAEQARLVGEYAVAVAARTGLTDAAVPIALAGSVLAHPGSPLASALRGELATALPHATPLVPLGSPVHGVAVEALAESGRPTGAAIIDRLIASDPG